MSVSIHTIALYSYAKLLAGLTGQLCVTFAEIFSLRNNTDLHGSETIFGPCFNTILTSIEVRKNESTMEALQRLQREIDQGREYRNASLADIQRGLIKQRGSSCKIDALFNMQVLLDETMSEDNEIISLCEMEDDGNLDSTQYALNFEFVQRGDMLSLVIKAHQECFSKEHLLETVKNFESIFNFTIKKPYEFSTEMPLPLNSLEGLRSGLIDNDQKQFSKSSYAQDLKDRSNDSPLQSLMFDTIGTVLQIDSTSISSETLLSSIGLDSIASMHLATRLRKKGVKVGVADIIQGKTVDGIIAKMQFREDETSKEHRNGELRKIGEHEKSLIASVAKQIDRSANEIEGCLPTLPGQSFELIQSGESGIYVFAYQFRKGAIVDVDRLQEAWSALRARHSILRTSFLEPNENSTGWQQIVLTKDADSTSKIDSHSIQKSFMTAIEEDGLDWFTSKIRVLLQPGKCPAGISLIHSPGGDVLLIRLHHALYDAWSLPILMQEFGNLYDNRKLEDVPDYTTYVRQVSQQRKKLSNIAQEYWKDILGDQQVPRIPFKSIDHSSSREALIMASWATILTYICKPTNSMKSTFGLYLTGRNESFDGIERMTGNLTNIVPVVASMEETNLCVYDTSKSVLLRLANQIKTQLDEHSHLDCFTSIKDILDWTGNDVIPWNSTLNLLWPREEGLVDKEANSTFTMIKDLLTKPYEKKNDKCERDIRSIDAYANVQIDIQFDPKTDNLHFGVKWDNALWSSSQVEKIMHDFCQLIQVGSAE
ncbi:hypothetical protein L7F22_068244 [Adiantum nelumboides]|nr:hypothetical protein [Adiantum nelumboides]